MKDIPYFETLEVTLLSIVKVKYDLSKSIKLEKINIPKSPFIYIFSYFESTNIKTIFFFICRYETIRSKRQSDADGERATVGCVLLSSRKVIVTQQHQQVQSHSSGSPTTAFTPGMPQCQSSWWCT